MLYLQKNKMQEGSGLQQFAISDIITLGNSEFIVVMILFAYIKWMSW